MQTYTMRYICDNCGKKSQTKTSAGFPFREMPKRWRSYLDGVNGNRYTFCCNCCKAEWKRDCLPVLDRRIAMHLAGWVSKPFIHELKIEQLLDSLDNFDLSGVKRVHRLF